MASQGRPCRIWLELQPAVGQIVPPGFGYHIEWLGPDGELDFVLKTRDGTQQIQEGNRVHLDVDIPADAPVGLYDPTHFEMYHGVGDHRQVCEESVDNVPLPSILVSAATNPEMPWPKVIGSG